MAVYTHTATAVPSGVAWYDVGISSTPVEATSTLIVVQNSDGTETRLIGTGLPGPTGIVAEMQRTSSGGGTVYETITGITGVTIGALGDALNAGNGSVFALIFNAADTF